MSSTSGRIVQGFSALAVAAALLVTMPTSANAMPPRDPGAPYGPAAGSCTPAGKTAHVPMTRMTIHDPGGPYLPAKTCR
jgi:hypothetical protein